MAAHVRELPGGSSSSQNASTTVTHGSSHLGDLRFWPAKRAGAIRRKRRCSLNAVSAAIGAPGAGDSETNEEYGRPRTGRCRSSPERGRVAGIAALYLPGSYRRR